MSIVMRSDFIQPVLLLLLLVPNFEPRSRASALMPQIFRGLQEVMLRFSMNRAQLNYGIVFKCRTTSDIRVGEEVHFTLKFGDLTGFRNLTPKRNLALFLHGWNDEGSQNWIHDMLKSWTYYQPNYSVCVVDWGHLSQLDYKTASMSIFDVGLTVAGIVLTLEQLQPGRFSRRNVTIAGYSLGAHAAGHAGALLDGEVEQIIGLDPAGPLFTLPSVVSPIYRLDETDAQFVQVLHTSGGTLGTFAKSGHADFYPNGGKAPQPNCKKSTNFPNLINTNSYGCSHATAPVFFKQSMDPEYPFVGLDCSDHQSFEKGLCAQNHNGRFGIHSKRISKGNFYFNTEPDAPYVPHRPDNQR